MHLNRLKHNERNKKKMKEYNEKLQITVENLTACARVKADVQSVKFATGYNALLLVGDLSDQQAYSRLFGALKRDCKAAGFKFAGTPIHKACNVVASLKFDHSEEWSKIVDSAETRAESTAEERLYGATSEWLKSHGLTFSAPVSRIDERINPTADSNESAQDAELQAVLAYIRTAGDSAFGAIVAECTARANQASEKRA